MKTRKYKHGLSLVEMLIVVGVIALLASMVISVASRIDTQTKEKNVKSLFLLLDSALEEYKEFKGSFPEQREKNFTNAAAHSEFLYGELYSVPDSRKVLEEISDSLIKNEYPPGVLPNNTFPEIYDPWQVNSKEYRRAVDYIYVSGDNFPELVSAGPDRNFGTADDITNK
jgi:prepilin-type N-terminal cleavage/methylation domain-containing protein